MIFIDKGKQFKSIKAPHWEFLHIWCKSWAKPSEISIEEEAISFKYDETFTGSSGL